MDQYFLEVAILIAVKAHMGQVDKAGKSYILHPLRVMQNVESIDAKIVAVLHDVLEDTDITLEILMTKISAFENYPKLSFFSLYTFIKSHSNLFSQS